ncbi:phage protease [Hafnia paralvei]|uniref:phage protease n=1 Tax=Hafnia paralvei TaxID=546367 RepID=UPI00300CC743
MWKLATASLSGIDKDNTARIQLFPAGWFGAPSGGQRWFLDAALAQRLIDAANSRVNDYQFDYEHQSLNAPQSSGPVPASGWFKSLTWVEGEGLFADVKWTARAASLIQADEYRYVSPTFRYDEQGNVRELVNAALTNMPVLDGMRQVAASLMFFDNGEKPMNENLRLVLCAIMGLKKEADEAAIQTALENLQDNQLREANCSSIGALIEAHKAQLAEKDLAIQESQTKIAALSVQQAGTPDLSQFVPVAVVDDLRNELASLSSQIQGDKVESLLTAALSDGRVMKGADEDNLRELGKNNYALMEKMIGTRKPIKALSRLQSDGMTFEGDRDNSVELTAEQLAICSQFGNTADDLTGDKK